MSFAPTQQEIALVNQVFAVADPSKLGIVTGEAAVKAFAGAKLSPTVLGEIWSISDKDNNGFLTKKGVAASVRLIGHAQKGEPMNETLLERPGPLAVLEGISAPSPMPSSVPSSPTPKSPPPTGQQQFPPLTPEDKSKFLRLFLGCGPVNGLLSGDKARDVFIKSKLPFEKLSQVWALSDTQDRGSLDQTDFTIAMYLIQAIMSGQLVNLPATLPLGLYERAGGRSPASVASHSTGNSITLNPSITGSFAAAMSNPSPLTVQTAGGGRARLQPQTTGQEYNRLSMAVSPQQHVHFEPNSVAVLGASAFGGASVQPWDVTTEEKTRFDHFFDGLDTQKRGFIEGDVAVPFMLQSKLSEETLAQVWDLADLNNDGRLTRDGFAVAMHLIQGKLAGRDIPSALPISLIPPSMRAGRLRASSPAPAPAPTPVPEPIRDLLWDDSPPACATAPRHPTSSLSSPSATQPTPVPQSQMTGHQQQHAGAVSVMGPQIPAVAKDPFGAPAFAAQANCDLLSDDEATAAVLDNSAEIGNLQNQISSTNRSLETTKSERHSTETTLATQASQLSALQTQLSSAKAAYETEMRLLAALRERFGAQSANIQKVREELIRAESDLSAVRVEKSEIEGNLLRDKEEVRDLQRKMKEVGEEAERMKTNVEKAKKETKHQKGMLAIAKKQLATREAERSKIAKELEDSEHEAQEATQECEAAGEELAKDTSLIQSNGVTSPISASFSAPLRTDTPSFAAAQPLPASPMSPSLLETLPSAKTNNPFERLAMASSNSRPTSPFIAPATDVFFVSTPQPQTEAPTADSSFSAPAAPDATSSPATDTPGASSPFVFAAEPSTSTIAPSAADTDDPFGLGDGDKMSSVTSVAAIPDKSSMPQPVSSLAPEDTKIPSSTTDESNALENASTKHEDASMELDIAAAQFPPIDRQMPDGSSGLEGLNRGSTDLNAKLEENEDEESDSDNEGDFHDAKEVRTSMGSPVDEFTNPVGAPKVTFTSSGVSSPPAVNAKLFEDGFGVKDSTKNSTPKADTQVTGLPPKRDFMEDLFSLPAPQPLEKDAVNGKAPEQCNLFDIPNAAGASGVVAFDEAMGKISSPSTSSASPQFKLDSAFDDNFDFSAAKAEREPSPFPPVSSSVPVVNGSQGPAKTHFDFSSPFGPSAQSKTQEGNGNGLSFDDAFGSVSSSRLSSQPSAGDHGISFEDAFGGRALAFDNAFGTQPVALAQAKPAEPKASPFPLHSPPRSPTLAVTPMSPSTMRSGRSASPPPRVSSPKPRISTGSSTDGNSLNKSPPPTRHSKLSIRLPFGRKDKKKSKPEPTSMPPPQFLSPVAEPAEPALVSTPAVEDDVEPVKQLCGMGFSRTQAVVALEKHGYDVQRALNSLLGGA